MQSIPFSPISPVVLTAASAARIAIGDNIWQWTERASWIAAILGVIAVGFVVIQIRQLLRSPKLRFGFPYDPEGPSPGWRLQRVREVDSIPVSQPVGPLSEPTQIAVAIINEGTASAQRLSVEIRYPTWLVPEGRHELERPPVINAWSYSKQDVLLHPGLTFYVRQAFRIPVGRTNIPIHVIASGLDTGPTYKELTINMLWQ